ncbi:MAG: hypothetical protein ACLQUY_20115 [Ktedonobacterales bacterium]
MADTTRRDSSLDSSSQRAQELRPPQPSRPFWQRPPFWLAVVVLLGVGGGVFWHVQSSSWTWYSDTHFPFRVQVPPAWHAGSWENVHSDGVADCSHNVDMFPPSSSASAGVAQELREPEVISIVVNINCPGFSVSVDPFHFQNPSPLTIGGKPATLYYNTSDPGEKVTHAVFGGRDYYFDLRAPSNRLQQDTALYLQVMRSFQYTGKYSDRSSAIFFLPLSRCASRGFLHCFGEIVSASHEA